MFGHKQDSKLNQTSEIVRGKTVSCFMFSTIFELENIHLQIYSSANKKIE